MTLGEYIKKIPLGERHHFRQRLAKLHGCSTSLVRKWEYSPAPEHWSEQKIRQMVRQHPADLESIKITEQATNGNVTRFDLRPEVFERDSDNV